MKFEQTDSGAGAKDRTTTAVKVLESEYGLHSTTTTRPSYGYDEFQCPNTPVQR